MSSNGNIIGPRVMQLSLSTNTVDVSGSFTGGEVKTDGDFSVNYFNSLGTGLIWQPLGYTSFKAAIKAVDEANFSRTGLGFFTGDDSIAGRYVNNLLIKDCVVNSSCNGIRIIGPITNMIVQDCLFYGPGLHPHRTSDRKNMLAGIILQPGGWDKCDGPLEDVLISDVTMKKVASPVTVMLKRAGNTVDNVTITDLTATGVYRAAASVESWCETACGRVVFRNVNIEYEGGGTAEQAKASPRKPGNEARALPVWGFYGKNTRDIKLENVNFYCVKDDLRPTILCEDIDSLVLDSVRFPQIPKAAGPVVFKNIKKVKSRDVDAFVPESGDKE